MCPGLHDVLKFDCIIFILLIAKMTIQLSNEVAKKSVQVLTVDGLTK